MTEYIEREAAINSLTEENLVLNLDSVMDGLSNQIKRSAHRILASLPAADVAPVRHGRWVVSRTDYSWNGAEFPTHCKCDQCGREVPHQDRENYCPNCGAKMDGDGDA